MDSQPRKGKKILKMNKYIKIRKRVKIFNFNFYAKFIQKNSWKKNFLFLKTFLFFLIKSKCLHFKKLKEYMKISMRLKFHLAQNRLIFQKKTISFKKKLTKKPQKKENILIKVLNTFLSIDNRKDCVLLKRNTSKIFFFEGGKPKTKKKSFKVEKKKPRSSYIQAQLKKKRSLKFFKNLKIGTSIKNHPDQNLKGQRLKNFSNFWDEACWITTMLFRNKIFVAIPQGKKKFKKFFEEIYILLIFFQIKKFDFCEICLKNKRFLSQFSLFFFFQTNVIMKILYLDNNWTELFIQKRKKKKFLRHYSFSTDMFVNKNIFSEKFGNNFPEKTCEESALFRFNVSYLSDTKFQFDSDNFFFCEKLDDSFPQKLWIISDSIVDSFLRYKKKKKYSKIIKKKRVFLQPIFFSKTYDSIHNFSFKNIWNGYLNIEKKLNEQEKIKILFFDIFSICVYRQNFWRGNFNVKEDTKNKCQEEFHETYMEESGRRNFYFSILFLKKKFFSLLFLVMRKISKSYNRIEKNIMVSFGFFFLSNFHFLFSKKIAEIDFDEKKNQETFFKFSILFSSFYYFKSKKQTRGKISSTNFIFIGKFSIVKKKDKEIDNFRVFLGIFPENKKKNLFDLNLNSKIFWHFVFYLMAKYKLKKIFFSFQGKEENLPKDVIGLRRTVFEKSFHQYEYNLDIEIDNSILLPFKKNLQVIKLKNNSLIHLVASSALMKLFSKCHDESIFNSILLFFEIGTICIYLIFIYNRKKTEVKIGHSINKSNYNNLKNTLFLSLENFVSQVKHYGEIFLKNFNFILFSRFVCNNESKKFYKLSQIFGCIENKKKKKKESISEFFSSVSSEEKNYLFLDLDKFYGKQSKNDRNWANFEDKKKKHLTKHLENKDVLIRDFSIKSFEYISWEKVQNDHFSLISFRINNCRKSINMKDYFLSGLKKETIEIVVQKKYISRNFLVFQKLLLGFITKHPIKIINTDFRAKHLSASIIPSFEKYRQSCFPKKEQSIKKNKNFLRCERLFRIFKKKNVHPKNFKKNGNYCLKLLYTKFYFSNKNTQKKLKNCFINFSKLEIRKNFFKIFYKKKIIQKLSKKNENYILNRNFNFLPYISLTRTTYFKILSYPRNKLKKILKSAVKNYLFIRTNKSSILLIIFMDSRNLGFFQILLRFCVQGKNVLLCHTNLGGREFFFKSEECLVKIKKRLKNFIRLFLTDIDFFEEKEKNFILKKNKKNSKKKFFFRIFVSKNRKKQFGIMYGIGHSHFNDFLSINIFGYEFRDKIFSTIDDIKKFVYLTFRHKNCFLV